MRPKRPESELLTLARRVEAARLALELDDNKWGPNNQVPKGKIPATLIPGQYHAPSIDRTLNRIRAMDNFPPELLEQSTISVDGIHAIACAEILKDATWDFTINLD